MRRRKYSSSLLVDSLVWIVFLVDGVVGLSKSGFTPFSSTLGPDLGNVQVWNNVLSPAIQSALHGTARSLGLSHQVFSRKFDESNRAIPRGNLVEESIDAILNELKDDSEYVEYWMRNEWRSIHAHADVDEFLAKRQRKEAEEGEFRYPCFGHVLYLNVGTKVRGPTCIFPGRRSGGDLVDRNGVWSPNAQEVELVTVPAIPGRLLRFQGDFLHAVSRPTDLWLLKCVQGAPVFEPEDEWGRSVVLFNTWGSKPPAEIPVDGCSNISSETAAAILRETLDRCNTISHWDPVYPSARSTISSKEDESGDHGNDRITAKIWLLGDYRRRGHQMQTVTLKATESLREALYQAEEVRSVFLEYA